MARVAKNKKIWQGLGIGLTAAVLAFVLQLAGVLDWAEYRLWDWRVATMAESRPASDRIVVILIDEYTIQWASENFGLRWPWKRQAYVSLLNFCRRADAKAVGFDLLFVDPSDDPVDDRSLARAIAQRQDFVLAMKPTRELDPNTRWPEEWPPAVLKVHGMQPPAYAKRYPQTDMSAASLPVPALAAEASVIGHVKGTAVHDGIVRYALPFCVFDGHYVPSLGLGMYLAAYPERELTVAEKVLHLGDRVIPLDSQGRTILKFRGPSQSHRTVSAAAVINSEMQLMQDQQPQLSPDLFRDKYVFVGVSADAAFDVWQTPVDDVYPGVELHATLLDNLLTNELIQPASYWLVVLMAVVLAGVAAVLSRLAAHVWQVALVTFLLLPLPIVLGLWQYHQGVWLPVAVLTAAVLLAGLGAGAVNYALEGRQRRFIREAFQLYLSPVVIARLVEHPEQLSLGGETRELTLFFSDIQGFTGISESLSPDRLTELLNKYLTAMTDIIHDFGGTIDKFEGDAVIAFWNAPLDAPDHPEQAVRAALRCQARLAELRPAFKELTGHDVYARIGLNTGPVVVGNMGSMQRFDYTFLGDAGNLAARLEGCNKQFGTYLMISEMTRSHLPADIPCRELGCLQVLGRSEAVRVYEPLASKPDKKKRQRLDRFASGLAKYYSGDFAAALAEFETIAAADPPADAYAERCRQLLADPPETWQGVWKMTRK